MAKVAHFVFGASKIGLTKTIGHGPRRDAFCLNFNNPSRWTCLILNKCIWTRNHQHHTRNKYGETMKSKDTSRYTNSKNHALEQKAVTISHRQTSTKVKLSASYLIPSAKFIQNTEDTPTAARPTIYALSSGRGVCGVAVIRVSGPNAGCALMALGRYTQLPRPRSAQLRTLSHPHTGEALDKALVIWFPGPQSFTGEDCCELQVHGGVAVVKGVLDALGTLDGLAPATPGDFTKRAFSHGQLDLTEVEGLGDLIHAETEAQRIQALRQMGGALSQLYQGWRAQLIKCVANVSAFIDFSEDELIEDNVLDEVMSMVQSLQGQVEKHLADGRRGERLRDGVHVTIIGEPNVGKSSILNSLCGRSAAIVSPTAGTTRDVVESAVNIAGYPVLLSDTAGLRNTTNDVEQEGVLRAKDRAVHADIRIIVIDARQLLPSSGQERVLLEPYMTRYLSSLGFTSDQQTDPEETGKNDSAKDGHGAVAGEAQPVPVVLASPDNSVRLCDSMMVVFNKSDLVDVGTLRNVIAGTDSSPQWTCLSCLTHEGMKEFTELLSAKVKHMCGNPSTGNPSLTQSRHRHHLTSCLRCLDSFLQHQNVDLVVAGEHLRRAVYQMGKLTGTITSEEILDVVFRDFCIGK